MGLFSGVLKIVPLFIFVRSAGCKLNSLFCERSHEFACATANPYLDEYLSCSIANNGTANTAEVMFWSEALWAPHYTEMLTKLSGGAIQDVTVPHRELLLAIGVLELLGWLLLWTPFERSGAMLLFFIMCGALEMHLVPMGEPLEKLGLQIALLFASGFVAFLQPKPQPPRPKRD